MTGPSRSVYSCFPCLELQALEFQIFKNPLWSLFYIFSVGVFMVHACLGWKKVTPVLGIPRGHIQKVEMIGYAIMIVMGLVYISFPLYVMATKPFSGLGLNVRNQFCSGSIWVSLVVKGYKGQPKKAQHTILGGVKTLSGHARPPRSQATKTAFRFREELSRRTPLRRSDFIGSDPILSMGIQHQKGWMSKYPHVHDVHQKVCYSTSHPYIFCFSCL